MNIQHCNKQHKLVFNSGYFPVSILFFALCCFALPACHRSYTPKPRGYFKITLPERGYQHFDNGSCPFTFEYPTYGVINRDTVFLDTIPENPCWFNITFPSLNGNLYLSYKDIDGKDMLRQLVEDAHAMTYKHTIKADYIDENYLQTPNHVSGIYYEVGGNAASAVQFFVTDSVKHFLRGSLYFYNVPNADSIAPVVNFIKPDILELIKSLHWKD